MGAALIRLLKSATEKMELWKDGPQFEQSEHFRLGTDSVLLADFVNIGARLRLGHTAAAASDKEHGTAYDGA